MIVDNESIEHGLPGMLLVQRTASREERRPFVREGGRIRRNFFRRGLSMRTENTSV